MNAGCRIRSRASDFNPVQAVDEEQDSDVLSAMACYIDMNPVRAGLEEDPAMYPLEWLWGRVRRGRAGPGRFDSLVRGRWHAGTGFGAEAPGKRHR